MTASVRSPTFVDGIRRFTVTIVIEAGEGDGMMRVASVLHRRQIDIRQAAYRREAATSRMEVVVETTASRVHTAALTLRNITGVTACEVSGCEDEERDTDAAIAWWTPDRRFRLGRAAAP